MAENNTSFDALKNDLNSMRSQLEELVKNANAKGHDAAEDMAARIARELHAYGQKASAQADKLREAGQAGLDEVGNQVRQNPLMSLLIAFGAGCIVSCLFRHLR